VIYSTITKYTQVFGIGKNRSVNSEEQFSAFRVEKILKGSLNSIPKPSFSVKIQIMSLPKM
jgi:hypothetical protein